MPDLENKEEILEDLTKEDVKTDVEEIKDDSIIKDVEIDIDDFILKNKDNNEFINKIKNAFGIDDEEIANLRALKENVDSNELLKEYSENPKAAIEKIKSMQDKIWSSKIKQMEDDIQKERDELKIKLKQIDDEKLSNSIKKVIVGFDIAPDVLDVVEEHLSNRFSFDSIDNIVNSDGVDIESYLRDYIKNKPSFLNIKSGSGTYFNGKDQVSKQNKVKYNSRIERS